jgi:hypothetical protein
LHRGRIFTRSVVAVSTESAAAPAPAADGAAQVRSAVEGQLIDLKANRNPTQERIDPLTAVNFKNLPLSLAIKQVNGKGTCDAPIDKITELGRKLRVTGTPTLIFANGKRVPGGVPGPQLIKLIDENSKPS